MDIAMMVYTYEDDGVSTDETRRFPWYGTAWGDFGDAGSTFRRVWGASVTMGCQYFNDRLLAFTVHSLTDLKFRMQFVELPLLKNLHLARRQQHTRTPITPQIQRQRPRQPPRRRRQQRRRQPSACPRRR